MCNDTFDVINPAVTGHVIQSVPDMDERDTAWAVESARVAQVEWGESTLKERSTKLKKLHDLVARNADYLTQIVTIEGVRLQVSNYLFCLIYKKIVAGTYTTAIVRSPPVGFTNGVKILLLHSFPPYFWTKSSARERIILTIIRK